MNLTDTSILCQGGAENNGNYIPQSSRSWASLLDGVVLYTEKSLRGLPIYKDAVGVFFNFYRLDISECVYIIHVKVSLELRAIYGNSTFLKTSESLRNSLGSYLFSEMQLLYSLASVRVCMYVYVIWVRVCLRVIVGKRYSVSPKAPRLEPHHQIFQCHI